LPSRVADSQQVIGYPFFNATKIDYLTQRRQGEDRKWQGKDAKRRHQGKARWQGIKARHAIGIGMPSSACHHWHHHRHAIIGIIIGMPSASACRQGMPSSASARHAIIGIGKASACHRHAIIGISRTQDAGRQNAAKWRSIVIQILKEC
jgi:hypothetical protein